LRKKIKRAVELKRRRRMEKRTSRWGQALEMTGGASGMIASAGAPLLRLLAEESGLRGGLSKTLCRSGFVPGHDRGQVLIDVAVALGLGATSVAGAVDVLRQSQAVLHAVASSPTAWRALEELDTAALVKICAARAAHRRGIWAALAARPDGFPWVQVAGQTWQGWIVLDVDASLVESHSDKQGAAPTYKKHIYGLHPIMVSVANTGELLAVLLPDLAHDLRSWSAARR
jgi:Transposase DDE domain group 1